MIAQRISIVLGLALSAPVLSAAASFQQNGNVLVMSNANVVLNYNLSTGTANFYWQNAEKIAGFYSAVSNSSSYITSTSYPGRIWGTLSGTEAAVTNSGGGLPTMVQFFTLDQTDSFLASVFLEASTNLQSNWMAPVVDNTIGGVNIGITNDNRALFVPFDNDHFVSYNSETMNGSDTGNEVGAFYDNVSRNGLVAGSVTHDVWKTGVYWSGSNNQLNQLEVFGGLTDHWTWDVMPHGSVYGKVISSPVIFVGFNNDWRTAMENFANENALFVAKAKWNGGVPFGWDSWGVTNYQSNISYPAAIAVSDSIHTNLQINGFTNGGTVYVNLDSYWDNLWTDWSGTNLENFVAHCHANGQKAGIYFTPFAFWGNANDATNYWVPVGYPPNYNLYRFSDILLRDGNGNFISNDGALAIDPTHPGTQGYIDYYLYWFQTWGFDYVKLDFLSLASLEGVHNDTNVTTGIEAYNEGMQYLANEINGTMFMSESIAPVFPYQYAQSRRIACDAEQSEIGNTEYTMNAVSYGWWLSGRLYQYNDPDLLVFDNGPDTNEVQSRLINGAVTGLFLNGSILTNAASVGMAQMCLTKAAIDAVARIGRTFRPVDGATGTGAGNIFARQDGTNLWRIAVFNYTASSVNETVNLSSAGLPAGSCTVTNLWSGAVSSAAGSFTVPLNEKQAALFSVALEQAAPSIVAEPVSYTNAVPMYAGVPLALSVSANGSLPFSYQWYEIMNGVTNAFSGGTNASLLQLSQMSDTNGPLTFFVVITNSYGSVTSSVAALNLSTVVPGTPDALSIQFTITNYAGYGGGFFLAPTDTAGVYGVSNWNAFVITPSGGSAGTQPGVTFSNLVDRFGVISPASIRVVNVSDGWHQTAQTITSADNANARMMNTFWKTHNDSSPSTNILYIIFTNIPNGTYSAYIYMMQNNPGATGCVYSANGFTNYFSEFTSFTSASNFVTAVDTNGTVYPYVNYLRLTGLSTGGSNCVQVAPVWLGGADGMGVCGVQLVPPPELAPNLRTPGQFELQFPAPNGQNYVIESSTDLLSWIPIATNSADGGWLIFTTPTPTNRGQYYRVRQ
ncbi:MAG TPA: hypothetical protein VGY56_21570 [Verrucomicrobiae bacterium]|nr:hypothetical protein [Verrucomicrobiae bacterium]